MEALIFLADIMAMTYLCWRIFKAGKGNAKKEDLGLFSYRLEKDDQK